MSKCVFLVAGRLLYIKGHDLLFDALERLPKELEYECRILGAGPNKRNIERRLKSSELHEHVLLKGAIPFAKMTEEYQKADVFVFPSLRESSGAVLLEAMSNGLPVITINKFGGAMILNQETGWLYEGTTKEEYIENLKNALTECIKNPEEVKRRGKKAREQAKEHTWTKRLLYYQSVYESLLIDGE